MKERESINQTAEQLNEAARHATEVGRDAASRASEYVRDGLERAADYAQDWSSRAGEQISELTGRPAAEWTRELRGFIEQHPIKSLLITVSLGYVLGKLVRHG